MLKYYVRVPLNIVYIGYTCSVIIDNSVNSVSISIIESSAKKDKNTKKLLKKIYYYLQAEGFIEYDTEYEEGY